MRQSFAKLNFVTCLKILYIKKGKISNYINKRREKKRVKGLNLKQWTNKAQKDVNKKDKKKKRKEKKKKSLKNKLYNI